MSRSRRLTIENNYKMTDFFTQHPSSSLPAPPSSAPVFSSKHHGRQQTESRRTMLPQTQPLMQVQSRLVTKPPASPLRSVKENAPPIPSPRSRVAPPSRRDATYISSSSDAQTHISISSASIQSVDSSVVEVVKQDRRQVQKHVVPSSSPFSSQKRHFKRSQATANRSNRTDNHGVVSQPRKPAQKKRKKPEGVQSDDGDVIDLEAMGEVIIISSTPARINLITPEPSERSRPKASRKLSCVDPSQPDAAEVIPSSQSDEQELSIPKKQRRNMREIEDNVREWQLNSSQSTFPPDASDKFEMSCDDLGIMVDMDYSSSPPRQRDRSKTPTSSARISNVLSRVTPRKISPVRTPTASSLSTPRRGTSSAAPESIRIPVRSNAPSPMGISSASSVTKINTPVHLISPEKNATPRSSSSKKSITVSPARSEMDIDAPLLNQNEKTNAIVERIKAEARAKAMTMPDDDIMILGSLNDSDSELGSPSNLLAELNKRPSRADKVPGSSKAAQQDFSDEYDSQLTDIDEADDQLDRRRIGLRSGRHSPSTRTRRVPNMLPTTLTNPVPAKPKKLVNPFTKLRREKARRDKIAELIASPGIDSDVNLSDAAEDVPRFGSGSPLRRQNSDEGDFETAVREADQRQLFSEGDTSALGRILESDRKDRRKVKEIGTELGVPIWETRGYGASSSDIPRLGVAARDPDVELIQQYIAAKDVDGLTTILQSDVLAIEDTEYLEWLFEIAICTSGRLGDAAHTALEHVCESRSNDTQGINISSSPVLKVIARLGARQEPLQALNVQVPPCDRWTPTDEKRSEVLWRLSEIIRLFASRTMLLAEAVPLLFGLLVAIGMDVKTDFTLKLSIKHALRTLIDAYCGTFSDERGEMEVNICSIVLGLIPGINAASKVLLLSFIDGSDAISRRIGQWIAFAMLAGDYGVQLAREVVAGPPSLADIIALLDPHLDSKLRSDIFNTSRNSDHYDTLDYAALTCHVEVLGRVLMNILQYVSLERKEAKQKQTDCDSPRHYKELSKLEIIKGLLERLGNNIADTRAAHLDRSQAKAVIQQLAMRIHYQRKASTNEKPKLDNYFGRNRST